MEFTQITNWYMQSAEGYRISKATSPCPGQYAAWAPNSKTETPAIGYTDTPKKAIALCEEHQQTHRKIK